jgi:hypothetical protein
MRTSSGVIIIASSMPSTRGTVCTIIVILFVLCVEKTSVFVGINNAHTHLIAVGFLHNTLFPHNIICV